MRRVYPIDPVAKPRQTQRDVWAKRPCVLRYRQFADDCRKLGMVLPSHGASVQFVIAMPKSWSEKKRAAMLGQPHTQKPDIDNLLKAIADAVHGDDSHIWHYAGLSKVWGETGGIIIQTNGDVK